MLFSFAAASMAFAAANAMVFPRQSANTTQSRDFKVHARCVGRTDFVDSLGFLYAEYAYPPGYYATLHTAESDGIVGHLTDVNNVSNSSLVFPEGEGYYQGFVLYTLSQQYPNSLAKIFSGQTGTKGMYIDSNGLLQWQSPDGIPISWFACENTPLEYGPATAVEYKWANTTTKAGCWDTELVVEYQ